MKCDIDGAEVRYEQARQRHQAYLAKHGPAPAPSPIRLLADDLAGLMPAEYLGAVIPAALAPALRSVITTGASLCLLGPPGTGKTRVLYACLAKAMLKAAGNGPVGPDQCADGWGISNRTEREWTRNALERAAQQIRFRIISESTDIRAHRHDRDWLAAQCAFPGCLGVDDVGCLPSDAWTQEAVYELSSQRRLHARATIWTSNLGQTEFRALFGPAIASRLLTGQIFELTGRDKRQ